MFKRINESFKNNINKYLLYGAFSLFIFILLWFVFFKCVGIAYESVIIYTSKTMTTLNIYERLIYQFRGGIYTTIGPENLEDNIENMVIFLPFGLFLPLINNKKFYINLFITLGISLLFEIIQLFNGMGGFELADLSSNVIGFCFGSLIYFLIRKILTNQVVNYICLVIIVLFLPFAIFCYTEIFIHIDLFKPFFSIDNYKNLFNFN